MTCYFESHTTYDETAYRALTYVMIRKVRPMPRILLISLSILMLFSGSALLFLNNTLSLGSSLLLLLGSVLFFFSIFLESFATKMLMKDQKADRSVVYHYQFFDQEFTVTNAVDTSTISYQSIRKILSFRGYLLFFADQQVYIVQVSRLSKGTGERLCQFLESRINKQKP
jgi:hypothetical protein